MKMSPKLLVTVAATGACAGIGLLYLFKRKAKKQDTENRLERVMSMLNADACCHIKDVAILRGQLRQMIEGGREKVQILTDFDKTLSKGYVDDERAHSSFQVIENSSQVKGSEIGAELHALHAKYYPLEMSPTLSNEEKTPLMIEWYHKSFNLGIKFGVRKSLLPSFVKESLIVLRLGIHEFFRQVSKLDIPLLVVSAGLGDVIDEVLEQQCERPRQLSVLANYYQFDDDGLALGLKEGTEMIHTFNKDQVYSFHQQYFDAHSNYTNALVMGDSLGDPIMTDNVHYLKCQLKIGFLNANVEASLQKYLEVYDIVLTDDAPMDLVAVLLPEMLAH